MTKVKTPTGIFLHVENFPAGIFLKNDKFICLFKYELSNVNGL